MKIRDIMTTRVVTADIDDTLEKIQDVFDHVKFHHILIVEGEKLVGVVSDRDLLKEFSANFERHRDGADDLRALKKHAHQVMSRKIVFVRPDANVKVAARLLVDQDLSCLPVVNVKGELEGIVTWRDFLKVFVKQPLVEPETA